MIGNVEWIGGRYGGEGRRQHRAFTVASRQAGQNSSVLWGIRLKSIQTSTVISTTTPTATLSQVIAFFRRHPIRSLGLAAFGPIDLDRGSSTYGRILSTPKIAWQKCPIVATLQTALEVPVAVDTDVNAAALAEATYGAGRECNPVVYLTVGTGIGGGAVVHGQPLHGLMHPEMGHMLLARAPGDSRPSGCPFHEDCLEGLASGYAIQLRFGRVKRRCLQSMRHGHWKRHIWGKPWRLSSLFCHRSGSSLAVGSCISRTCFPASVRPVHRCCVAICRVSKLQRL